MNSTIKILGIIIISFFIILVVITSYTEKNNIEYTGAEMQQVVLESEYVIDSVTLEEMTGHVIVDLRSTDDIVRKPIQPAVQMPLSEILEKENQSVFSSDRSKVLVSSDPLQAHEAWMLLTQMGYKQIFVLQ